MRHTTERTPRTWLITFLILLVGIISLGYSAQAQAHNATASVSTSLSPLDCTLDWREVPNPDVPMAYEELLDLAVVSPNDIWAVGTLISNGVASLLTEHWDGQQWTIVPTPDIGMSDFQLSSVSALASNNVWAVGYSYHAYGRLMIHWDGTSWTRVSLPDPEIGELFAVEAISANNIWAAGDYSQNSWSYVLIMHWDGTAWSQISAPGGSFLENKINSIKAISANDIWAVGYYRDETTGRAAPLTLHWNGTAWSLVPAPVSNGSRSYLFSLAPVATNDVWVVGHTYPDSGSNAQSLIMHWNGSAWSVIPISDAPDGCCGAYLKDITVVSANDIWSVGYINDVPTAGIMLHWNGSTWTAVPDASSTGYLFGIEAISATNIWAVGSGQTSGFIEHYSTDCPLPTFTPVATSTATGTPTDTPTSTPTDTPTNTATPLPPRCPGERFTDVCPGDYFYAPVLALNDDGIINGYASAPPCDGPAHVPCFKPYNNVTRAQLAKIISLAAGFNEPVTTRTFEDVPTDHTFYQVIERMAAHNIISGYPCGSPGEPCGPGNLPYFRPAGAVTRGQITKMTTLAFNFNDPVSGQTFEDVPIGSTFYQYIERMSGRSIINGYACGGSGEPCGPGNLPYFRPANPVTRGQTAKITDLARTQPTPTAISK